MLLRYAQTKLGRLPSALNLSDLNPSLISGFLDEIEKKRKGTARTRNLRLTAIRSFFRYAALEAPEHSDLIQRVLAIPPKRHCRKVVGFLSRPEIEALLGVIDRASWIGHRDYALLLTMMQTGLRLAETTALRDDDVHLGIGAHIRCEGKGRKERCTPLTKSTAAVLRSWVARRGNETSRLFPARYGDRLSHDAVEGLVAKYSRAAAGRCPSFARRKVTPHMLRHTAAMELLQAGIDRSLIAIWLGHESVETTQIYLDANLELKEKILERMKPTKGTPTRFRPGDRLLAYLQAL